MYNETLIKLALIKAKNTIILLEQNLRDHANPGNKTRLTVIEEQKIAFDNAKEFHRIMQDSDIVQLLTKTTKTETDGGAEKTGA